MSFRSQDQRRAVMAKYAAGYASGALGGAAISRVARRLKRSRQVLYRTEMGAARAASHRYWEAGAHLSALNTLRTQFPSTAATDAFRQAGQHVQLLKDRKSVV